MSVLLVSDEDDRTAGRVAAELAGRGVPVNWIDAGDFPTEIGMTANSDGGWHGHLTGCDGVEIGLAAITGIYYRRPTQFRLAEGMSGPEQQFAYGEARRGFGGVLQALSDARWVNDPVASARAEYKQAGPIGRSRAVRACGSEDDDQQ